MWEQHFNREILEISIQFHELRFQAFKSENPELDFEKNFAGEDLILLEVPILIFWIPWNQNSGSLI